MAMAMAMGGGGCGGGMEWAMATPCSDQRSQEMRLWFGSVAAAAHPQQGQSAVSSQPSAVSNSSSQQSAVSSQQSTKPQQSFVGSLSRFLSHTRNG